MKRFISVLIISLALTGRAELTVFAAASTTDVMKELAAAFKAQSGDDIRFNFASSGSLARQIDAGAPADLFISANIKWMNWLTEQGLVDGKPVNVARNTLVLIAPADSSMTYDGFPENLKGRLAVGDFQSVPAGTYAEAALKSLGWLDAVSGKLVKGASVRTVLMYVERAEVDAGIVYMTDAMQSGKVKVLGVFTPGSYPPIVYPAACLSGADSSAETFLMFILGDAAKDIWKRYGFDPIKTEKKKEK